ncbi:MAG: IS66 family transposase, partial [Pseudomonadota bacterium]
MTQTANTLPDDISSLKAIIAQQILQHEKTVVELAQVKTENERLEELVRLLQHRHFGARSEKVKGDERQLPLGIFNEAEAEAKSSEQGPGVEVRGYRRRGKPKRVVFPADLPREDIIVDIPESERICPEGHELKCIGEDVSEQLDVIPVQIKVIRTIRKKYACPVCEGHVKRAPPPPTAIPKSMASAGLLAYIATSKYGDGLPLYRQEHMWQRAGIEIPRATMASWMIKVSELLVPMINLMEDDLLEGGFVGADETRVQVLNEEGKLATQQSYMWVRGREYPGAKPIVLFEYDPTRGGDVAKRLFANYQGYLQADGYGGYNGICEQKGIIRCGCL